MAVGYSRTATVQVLLDYGADPEVADKEGRTVVELVEKLRAAMPLTPELLGRRTMLEDVAGVLTGALQQLAGYTVPSLPCDQAWSDAECAHDCCCFLTSVKLFEFLLHRPIHSMR